MRKNTFKTTLGLLVFATSIGLQIEYSEALSVGAKKVINTKIGDDGTVMEYQFNPAYGSQQSNYYQNRKMTREVYIPDNPNYMGGFVWYSIVPSKVTNLKDTDLGYMLENRQTAVGNGGQYLVKGAGLNVKYGASDPWSSQYYGYNTGTKKIKYGNYKGLNYEYRFIAYNSYGNAVGNPYFPADNSSKALKNVLTKAQAGEYWSKRAWIQNSWTLPKSINLFGPADELNDYNQKVQWIEKYFFADYPAFRNVGDAYYWANRLRPLTNPSTETGVWIGFHKADGVTWYTQFVTTPPEQTNLRIVNYSVYDSGGNLIGKMTRNGTYNTNVTKTTTYNKTKVSKGQTYTVKVDMKNMTGKTQNIRNKKINIEHMYQFDKDIGKQGEYSTQVNEKRAEAPNDMNLNSGEVAHFEYKYTVPTDAKPNEKINFMADIPNYFFEYGHNTNTNDDDASLEFGIASENLKVEFTEFYNEGRQMVQYVTPGERMWVKYKLTKTDGSRPVNLADLQIMLTDELSTTTNNTYVLEQAKKADQKTVISDKVLRESGDYAVVWASIVPNQPKVCTQASIPSKWATAGLNAIASDDVTEKVCLTNPDNIMVTNFVADPETTFTTKSSESISYTVNFDLSNVNNIKTTKSIPLVYTIDGRIVKTEEVVVPSNKTMKVSTTLPAVNLAPSKTGHIVQVEANPAPRKYVETKVSQRGRPSDPYEDNIGFDLVYVTKTQGNDGEYCKVEKTANNWNKQFTLSYWYPDSYWVPGTEYSSGYWQPYTAWRYEYPIVSFSESHKITNIYFKSKQTDGWIDLLDGEKAVIKAGYAFELKVVTMYETNTFDNTPKPYNNGSSGRNVSPTYGVSTSDTQVDIKMPFVDKYGNEVAVTLDGQKNGAWYDNTTTYSLTTLQDKEKLYVSENTKDGEYKIRISTRAFAGSPDKPFASMLCDVENITIKVKGSYLDDVKTHIIQ